MNELLDEVAIKINEIKDNSIVIRVERHIIIKSKELADLTDKARRLYNRANYLIRQKFISTSKQKEEGKIDKAIYLNYYEIIKLVKQGEILEYYDLPVQTSQQILKLLDKNWRSFFKAIKEYKKTPDKFLGKPKIPDFSKTGKSIAIFTNQQVKRKKDYLYFPKKSNIPPLKTKIQGIIKQVRIIPRYTCYVIEVVYEKKINKNNNLDNSAIMGIDLGVNNLVAIITNKQYQPLLINGRPLKAINQYFNKQRAKFMSYVGNKGTSNRIKKLTHKRNQKINDYMHKVSKFVVNYAEIHRIKTIVIGYNKTWKQELTIGKKNNQTFVNIPFNKFVNQIKYKAEERGIDVVITEENYTSKCSFVDKEEIGNHLNYVGKRMKRGLFKTATGKIINADLNGAGNIIRKVASNAFLMAEEVEVAGLPPLKITLNTSNFHKQKQNLLKTKNKFNVFVT
jgi:putative transposase